jgi:hypothetical protein
MKFESIPEKLKIYRRSGHIVVSSKEGRVDTIPSVRGAILMYKASAAEKDRPRLNNEGRTVENILKAIDAAIEAGDTGYPAELDEILMQLRLSTKDTLYTDSEGIPLKAKQHELMVEATNLICGWTLTHVISHANLNYGIQMAVRALKAEADLEYKEISSQGRWGRVFYRFDCNPKKCHDWLNRAVALTIIGVMFDFGPTPVIENPDLFRTAFKKFKEAYPNSDDTAHAIWVYEALCNKKFSNVNPN